MSNSLQEMPVSQRKWVCYESQHMPALKKPALLLCVCAYPKTSLCYLMCQPPHNSVSCVCVWICELVRFDTQYVLLEKNDSEKFHTCGLSFLMFQRNHTHTYRCMWVCVSVCVGWWAWSITASAYPKLYPWYNDSNGIQNSSTLHDQSNSAPTKRGQSVQ